MPGSNQTELSTEPACTVPGRPNLVALASSIASPTFKNGMTEAIRPKGSLHATAISFETSEWMVDATTRSRRRSRRLPFSLAAGTPRHSARGLGSTPSTSRRRSVPQRMTRWRLHPRIAAIRKRTGRRGLPEFHLFGAVNRELSDLSDGTVGSIREHAEQHPELDRRCLSEFRRLLLRVVSEVVLVAAVFVNEPGVQTGDRSRWPPRPPVPERRRIAGSPSFHRSVRRLLKASIPTGVWPSHPDYNITFRVFAIRPKTR